MDQRYSYDTYHLRRKVFQFLGKVFHITGPDGSRLFYCKQKAFKLKEDIRLYADEQQNQEMLVIKARQIFDFAAAYDIVDSTENLKVGALKRKGWSSLIRDKWIIMDAHDREIGMVQEDSTGLALVRRTITSLIPQNFNVFINNESVAEIKQQFNLLIYKIDMQITSPSFDRRLAIAIQVLLAAIEGRQEG